MSDDREVLVTMEDIVSRLNVVDTEQRELLVKKDQAIAAIQATYAPLIDPLNDEREQLMRRLADLWVQHESTLIGAGGKSVVLRSGTLSSRTSVGSLVVSDEPQALNWLKRHRLLTAFTTLVRKRSLDKNKLKKRPELVERIPGIAIDRPEHLSVRLARTNVELKQDLHPHRLRIG